MAHDIYVQKKTFKCSIKYKLNKKIENMIMLLSYLPQVSVLFDVNTFATNEKTIINAV